MADRVIVLTGASGGIGLIAAQQMAAGGAHVVLVGRNAEKTRAAAHAIGGADNNAAVSYEVADLSLQHETRALAARIAERHPRIAVLINNAGAIFSERRETPEGLERTFALNHLAPFTLTLLLLPQLCAAAEASAPARIITVASRAHQGARLDLSDLQSVGSFGAWRAYNNSKLANILFTRSLAQKLPASRITAHALHPGLVSTRFALDNGLWGRTMRALMNIPAISPDAGADTMVWLATAPEAAARTGVYWVKRKEHLVSAAAQDDAAAEALWQKSSELAGMNADALLRAATCSG